MRLERFAGGSPAFCEKLNQIVDAVNALGSQRVDGGMLDSHMSLSGTAARLSVDRLQRYLPKRGGGAGGAATAAFAKITSKAGIAPPYRYAAVETTMDEDGGWSEPSGGDAYNNVFNIEEQGFGGQWVNPLLVGDVVLLFAAPDSGVDAFVCTRSHYRGTY